jgi:hypothetical protein
VALSCYHALPFIVILGLKYVPWGGDEGAVDFGAEEGVEFADVAGDFGTARGGGERSRDCARLVESIDFLAWMI